MNVTTSKKTWAAPKVETLAVEKTLGGIILSKNESFVLQTTGGPINGTS